jgi:hypothetical protein
VQVVASVPLYPPRSRVGAWLATHQFLRELVGRGHHVAVCTYLASDPGYELDGVQVHPAIALEQLARRADVLVAHAASRVKLERFTARTGAPLVRIVHGRHPPADRSMMLRWSSTTPRRLLEHGQHPGSSVTRRRSPRITWSRRPAGSSRRSTSPGTRAARCSGSSSLRFPRGASWESWEPTGRRCALIYRISSSGRSRAT